MYKKVKLKEGDKLVSKDGNFHYRVSQLKDDKVYFVKRGGGWVRSVPLDKADQYFNKVEEYPAELKNVRVCLNSDPEHSFPAVSDPYDRWNGWAKPYFTRTTLEEIIEALDLKVQQESSEVITFEDIIPAERIILGSQEYWDLGAGVWTWCIEEVIE